MGQQLSLPSLTLVHCSILLLAIVTGLVYLNPKTRFTFFTRFLETAEQRSNRIARELIKEVELEKVTSSQTSTTSMKDDSKKASSSNPCSSSQSRKQKKKQHVQNMSREQEIERKKGMVAKQQRLQREEKKREDKAAASLVQARALNEMKVVINRPSSVEELASLQQHNKSNEKGTQASTPASSAPQIQSAIQPVLPVTLVRPLPSTIEVVNKVVVNLKVVPKETVAKSTPNPPTQPEQVVKSSGVLIASTPTPSSAPVVNSKKKDNLPAPPKVSSVPFSSGNVRLVSANIAQAQRNLVPRLRGSALLPKQRGRLVVKPVVKRGPVQPVEVEGTAVEYGKEVSECDDEVDREITIAEIVVDGVEVECLVHRSCVNQARTGRSPLPPTVARSVEVKCQSVNMVDSGTPSITEVLKPEQQPLLEECTAQEDTRVLPVDKQSIVSSDADKPSTKEEDTSTTVAITAPEATKGVINSPSILKKPTPTSPSTSIPTNSSPPPSSSPASTTITSTTTNPQPRWSDEEEWSEKLFNKKFNNAISTNSACSRSTSSDDQKSSSSGGVEVEVEMEGEKKGEVKTQAQAQTQPKGKGKVLRFEDLKVRFASSSSSLSSSPLPAVSSSSSPFSASQAAPSSDEQQGSNEGVAIERTVKRKVKGKIWSIQDLEARFSSPLQSSPSPSPSPPAPLSSLSYSSSTKKTTVNKDEKKTREEGKVLSIADLEARFSSAPTKKVLLAKTSGLLWRD